MFDACLLACALGSRHGCRHVLAEPVMASPASPSPNPLCSTRQSLHSSGEHEEIAAATETWPRMSAGSRHDPDKVLCQHGLAYISQPGRLGSCDSHLTDETSTAQTSPAGPSWGSAEGAAQGLPFPEVSPQSPVPALCQAGLCMPHSRLPGLVAPPPPPLPRFRRRCRGTTARETRKALPRSCAQPCPPGRLLVAYFSEVEPPGVPVNLQLPGSQDRAYGLQMGDPRICISLKPPRRGCDRLS